MSRRPSEYFLENVRTNTVKTSRNKPVVSHYMRLGNVSKTRPKHLMVCDDTFSNATLVRTVLRPYLRNVMWVGRELNNKPFL